MLPLLLAASALAVPPTGQAVGLDTSVSVEVTDGAVDNDGELVSFVGGGQVHVVHIPTWTVASATPCDVTGAAIVEVGGVDEVWVGCQSGAAHLLALDGDTLEAVVDTNDESIVFLAMDGEIHSVQASPDFDRVYFVGDTGETTEQVAIFDAIEGEVVADLPLGMPDYQASAIGPQHLFVAHDNGFMSAVNLGANTLGVSITPQPIDVSDLAVTSRLTAFVVDRDSSVWEYVPTQFGYNALLPSAPDIQAIGTSVVTGDEFALFAYDDSVDVYPMTGGVLGALSNTFDIDGTVRDVVTTEAGYTFAGTTGGRLLVWTHRPWISDVEPSAVDVTEGQTVTVDFTTDRAGDWQVVLGGTWESGGQVLGSGTTSAAGDVTAELIVGDWDEGENDVFVRLTDGDGNVGHGRTRMVVDTPPDAVSLTEGDVSFDNELVRLSFVALDAPDIATYAVYITTTPFEAADYPTGGPAFDGADDLEAPVQVSEFSPGGSVDVTLSPLTNDQTYYLAVRATDEGGLEGPMSDVVSGTPRPTFTAAELAGEPGGCDCSSPGATGLPGLAVFGLAGLVGFVRRRRTVAAALLAVGLGVLAAPTLAEAQDDESTDESAADERDDRQRGDLTEAWGNVEIRYGIIQFEDEQLNSVYGESGNNVLILEFGPQLYRFVELDFGLGFVQELANEVDVGGAAGSSRTMFTAIPMSAALTGRLHILDEQILVPYASIGLDAWTYEERNDDGSGGKEKLSGTKFGNHWAVGGSLMLDVFSGRRASLLEAQTGINDTYLTFEYRKQHLPGSVGFSFSGASFTAGLKFDF